MIAPCLYEIHHDPRNFAEPHKFDPSRFLDPSGRRFVPHPALVPYGFGKRECLGKTLAKEWTLESSQVYHIIWTNDSDLKSLA